MRSMELKDITLLPLKTKQNASVKRSLSLSLLLAHSETRARVRRTDTCTAGDGERHCAGLNSFSPPVAAAAHVQSALPLFYMTNKAREREQKGANKMKIDAYINLRGEMLRLHCALGSPDRQCNEL